MSLRYKIGLIIVVFFRWVRSERGANPKFRGRLVPSTPRAPGACGRPARDTSPT